MAAGALVNSRALVSIAVTGQAGPVGKDSLEDLGVVDAAVSIRTTSPHQDGPVSARGEPKTSVFNTRHVRMMLCDGDGLPITHAACRQYRAEAEADPKGFVSDPILSLTRKLIRQNVVIEALRMARQHLHEFVCEEDGDTVTCASLGSLCIAPYDGRYTAYGEPSWVIETHSVECAPPE